MGAGTGGTGVDPRNPGAWGPPGGPFGPPPGHGPRPAQAAPPRPPRRSMGCVALFVLGALALGGGIAAFVYLLIALTAPPRDAGHAFLAKLRSHDYEGAWDKTTPDFKSAHPKEAFEAMVAHALPGAADSTDASFSSTSIKGDTACVSGSLSTSHGDRSLRLRLEKVGDAWLVDDFSTERLAGCK